MNSINSPEYFRNYGFWNEIEQTAVMRTHAALAGVGGDGYQLGLKLARMGVGEFSVADPEVFEPQNVNRVPGATTETTGVYGPAVNKAVAFAADVRKINPDAKVTTYTEGLSAQNVGAFLSRATIAFDETELTKLELGTMLSDEAIKRGIPDVLVMNVGFAAQVTSFHPDGRFTFRDLMGIPKDMPLDEVAGQPLDLSRCLPYVPSYVDRETLEVVRNDPKASLPSIAPGVDLATAMGLSQAFLHMVGPVSPRRQEPIWAKHIGYMDALTLKSGVAKHPQLSHYRYLAALVARNALSLNAKTSYSSEDRARREAAYKAERPA